VLSAERWKREIGERSSVVNTIPVVVEMATVFKDGD
jgi:hypothetical protein